MQTFNKSIHFISAIIIGNILEWYGFTIFVHFLPMIMRLLFAHQANTLLQWLEGSLFAAGFLLRPIGGLLFGHIGDRYSRMDSLLISIFAILLPTFLIGLLPMAPSWATFSIVAMILLRLVQGISAGGEFPSCIAYAVENAPANYRGVYGSIPFAGAFIGMLLAELTRIILLHIMPHDDLLAWGWRIPFLFTAVLGVVGFLLRKNLHDSQVFLHFKKSHHVLQAPVYTAIKTESNRLLRGILIAAITATSIYLMIIYMSNLVDTILHRNDISELRLVFLSLLSLSIGCPIMALFSDILGRKPVLICGCIGMILTAPALFALFAEGKMFEIMIAEVLLGMLVACIAGPLPAFLAELYATQTRNSSIAISYNLAFAVFGGLSPFIAIWFAHWTGSFLGISFYVILIAVVSCVVVMFMQETHKRPLSMTSCDKNTFTDSFQGEGNVL